RDPLLMSSWYFFTLTSCTDTPIRVLAQIPNRTPKAVRATMVSPMLKGWSTGRKTVATMPAIAPMIAPYSMPRLLACTRSLVWRTLALLRSSLSSSTWFLQSMWICSLGMPRSLSSWAMETVLTALGVRKYKRCMGASSMGRKDSLQSCLAVGDTRCYLEYSKENRLILRRKQPCRSVRHRRNWARAESGAGILATIPAHREGAWWSLGDGSDGCSLWF